MAGCASVMRHETDQQGNGPDVPGTTDAGGELTFSPSASRLVARVLWTCVACEHLLVLLDAFINYGRLVPLSPVRRLFNIAREDSLATWFASVQTLAVGLTAALLAAAARRTDASRFRRAGWTIVAVFFLFMAADDAAEIHERMGSAFKAAVAPAVEGAAGSSVGQALLDAYPSYPWQLVVGPLFAAVGVFMLVFFWKAFPGRRARIMLGSAFALYAFALGLDFVEGIDGVHARLAEAWGCRTYTVRHFSKSAEEFLEMLGTTFFLVSFLRRFCETCRSVRVELRR